MAVRSWSSDNVFLCTKCGTYQHKVAGKRTQHCPKCKATSETRREETPQQKGARVEAQRRKDKTKALATLCVHKYLREDMTLPSASSMVLMLYRDTKEVLSRSALSRFLHEMDYEPVTGGKDKVGWELKRR